MSYTQVSAGDLIKASIANANWRHMGRADLSSFYPMDIDGNYSAQALGETSKEWTTGKFTGDITTDTDINAVDGNFSGGINTDGKETIKFDIISKSVTSGDQVLAHGKSTNIRGVSIPYSSNSSVNITDILVNNTNIKYNSNGTTTVYFTVYYI